MKIKNLFLAGLVVFGMASCGNDEVANGSDQGNPLAGYLTLTLHSGSMGTRTDGSETEVGTSAENAINDVTVVLTDVSGDIEYVENTTIAYGTTTKKFAVSAGNYLIFALVNNAVTGITGNIAQVLEGATAADITGGFKNGSFFMTNTQNETDKTVLDSGISLSLAAGDEKVVSVGVDRLAAKVRDKSENPDLTDLLSNENVSTIMDGVKVVGFVPMNLNPDMNLIQTWGVRNSEEIADLANAVLLTPVKACNAYLLPATTYKEIETVDGVPVGITDKTNENQYVKQVYVTENRPTIKLNANGVVTALRQGQTTAVIYRVVAQKGSSDVATFYAYNGKVYASIAAIKAAVPSLDLDGKTIGDLRKMGISVYENGVMYYTYYIKGNNTNYVLAGKDYYGVFRNSIYDLKIISISNLGDDVPDDSKNPEEPVDPETAKISVDVNIKDWVLNEIGIEF